MRRCFYLLLILLLPLRGWVGDAMATQMAAPASAHHAVAQATADHGHVAGSPAHAHPAALAIPAAAAIDCLTHAGAHDASSVADDASHCGSCAMCQTCHTVAVLALVQLPEASQSRPAVPLFAATGFTSADRTLVLKPPET